MSIFDFFRIKKQPTQIDIEAQRMAAARAATRARAAKEIIENEELQAAVKRLREGYFIEWSNATEYPARVKLWEMNAALSALLLELERVIIQADVERNTLESLESLENLERMQ